MRPRPDSHGHTDGGDDKDAGSAGAPAKTTKRPKLNLEEEAPSSPPGGGGKRARKRAARIRMRGDECM